MGLKEDNLWQRNCKNQLNHPSLSGIEQECQESLIQEKIQIEQNWIFVQLSSRELYGSKLSGLHPFDNIDIIHWFKNRLKTER